MIKWLKTMIIVYIKIIIVNDENGLQRKWLFVMINSNCQKLNDIIVFIEISSHWQLIGYSDTRWINHMITLNFRLMIQICTQKFFLHSRICLECICSRICQFLRKICSESKLKLTAWVGYRGLLQELSKSHKFAPKERDLFMTLSENAFYIRYASLFVRSIPIRQFWHSRTQTISSPEDPFVHSSRRLKISLNLSAIVTASNWEKRSKFWRKTRISRVSVPIPRTYAEPINQISRHCLLMCKAPRLSSINSDVWFTPLIVAVCWGDPSLATRIHVSDSWRERKLWIRSDLGMWTIDQNQWRKVGRCFFASIDRAFGDGSIGTPWVLRTETGTRGK
jgi:hypothetical protein